MLSYTKTSQVVRFPDDCSALTAMTDSELHWHDIEKLFIEYAWVFYTKAAAPRAAAQRAPGADSEAPSRKARATRRDKLLRKPTA